MSFGNKEANACLLEYLVYSRFIGTLRQPYSTRLSTKMFLIMAYRYADLGTHGIHIVIHKGQVTMGGPAGNYLQLARILKFFEGIYNVPMVFFCKYVSCIDKMPVIHLREPVKFRLMFRSFDLFFRKFDPFFDVANVTGLQKRIGKHRDQRRGQRHGYAKIDTVIDQLVKDIDKGDVGFGNGLKEPVFFKEFAVLRMTDKRQVR